MATAFGGFSIREYTSKMRTLDVAKTWPFAFESDEVRKQTAEAFLPPIAVAKFRWWSDELELHRSNQDKVNQVPDLERTRDEIQIVNAEVEAEILNTSEEERDKFEKVCPVCRVFAASTVNAVNAHIDGCLAQASTEQQWQTKKASSKAKSRVPKKRSMADIFSVAPPIEAITMVEYKNDESKNGDDRKQEEIDKRKTSKYRVFLSAIETIKEAKRMKKITKKDRISQQTSVPSCKRLNKHKKKLQNGKREKLIPTKETHLQMDHEKGQCVLPFKKRRSGEILNICSTRRNKTCTRSSSKQKKNKHFDKDELNSTKKVSTAPSRIILKKKWKVTPDFGSPYLSLQSKDEDKFDGPQRSERSVRFSDKEEIIGAESFAALKEKEKSIEANEEVAPFGAGESRDISTNVRCLTGKRQSSTSNEHDEVMKSFSTNNATIHDKGYPSGGANAWEERYKLCAKTQVHSNVSKPLDSYLQSIDRLEDPVHGSEKSSVTNSSFSIPSRSEAKPYGRFPFQVGGSRNHMDGEFFGLPLNSQGELIPLGPSLTSQFGQQMESRSIASSSKSLPLRTTFLPMNASNYRTAYQMHHSERELPQYQFNLFRASQKMQLPAEVVESEGIRRAEIQWLNFERGTHRPMNPFPPESNSSPFNVSFDGRRHLGKVQGPKAYHEYPTQQTMRLMGKDVAIGGSSKEVQGEEGGKFWRNCHNMIEYLPANTSPYNPRVFFQGQLGQEPSEIPRQALFHQSRFQNNQRLQSDLLINTEHGTGYGDRNAAGVSFKGNPSSFTLEPMMSAYQNSCQEMYGSARVFKERLQLPTVYKCLPPWMSQSKQQEIAPWSTSRVLGAMNWSNLSHASRRNSILNSASTNHVPRAPCHFNLTTSNSYTKKGPSSTPLFQSKFINNLNIKDSGPYNKTNKRTPANEPVYPRKSPKLPISKMQDYAASFNVGSFYQ